MTKMVPCGLRLSAFVIIMFTVKISSLDLHIKAFSNYYSKYMTVYFSETEISRFADCVCNPSATKCTIQNLRYYSFAFDNAQVSNYTENTGLNEFKNIYTCKFSGNSMLTCLRNTKTNNYNGKSLLYIDDYSACNINCVGLLWNKWEYASITHNTATIFQNGDVPAKCSSSTITTGTTSKINTTIRSTVGLTTTTTKSTTTFSTADINFITFLNTSKAPLSSTVSFNISGSGSISDDLNNTTAIIVGIVVGFVLVLAVSVGTVIFIRRRRKLLKRTTSSLKVYTNGHFNETYPGANVSAFSVVNNDNSKHDNKTQYQRNETNSELNSEDEIGAYLNVKCFSKEESNPIPSVTSSPGVIQSNGVYSFASLSDSGNASNSNYSSPNKHTEILKGTTIHENTSSPSSTDGIYSYQKKSGQDENNDNQDSPTLHYLLANEIHDKGSQDPTVAADVDNFSQDSPRLSYLLAHNIYDKGSQSNTVAAKVDNTTNVQTHTYATLGDPGKIFTHPYNCLSDSTKSSTVPTNDENPASSDTADNQSTDYCVASSFSVAEELSQPDSNTIGDDVISVYTDYDLAKV